MELAHTVGEGGPELELLILSGGMLVLAVVFFVQKSVKPAVSMVLFAAAVVAGIGAFALGGGDGTDESSAGTVPAPAGVSIEIVRPEDGGTVPADEPFEFEVRIDGGSLTDESTSDDPTEGHLHVFIDGEIVSMPVSEVGEIQLEPGTHEVVIEFTAANHLSYDPRILDEVTVTAE